MTPDDRTIRDPDQIRRDCARKLRAVEVSEHFQAILGWILGEDWTTPRLVEMAVTGRPLAGSVRRRGGVQGVPRRFRRTHQKIVYDEHSALGESADYH